MRPLKLTIDNFMSYDHWTRPLWWEQMGKPERFTVIGVKGLWIHTRTEDAKPI